jgi:hypothetical protein
MFVRQMVPNQQTKKVITSLLIPRELREQVVRLAEREDRSLGAEIRRALRRHLLMEDGP